MAKRGNGEATLADVVEVLGNLLKVVTSHGKRLDQVVDEQKLQRDENKLQREVLLRIVDRLDGLGERIDRLATDIVRSRTFDSERLLSHDARITRLETHVFGGPPEPARP